MAARPSTRRSWRSRRGPLTLGVRMVPRLQASHRQACCGRRRRTRPDRCHPRCGPRCRQH
eukprot:3408331-Alexandrium_andersonii.AAC.1